MSGVKFSTQIEGIDRLSRAFKLAQPAIKARVVTAIRKNADAVLARSETKVHRRSGELSATGRAEFANDGLVGMVKYGYGVLARRSKATTGRGAKRLLKIKQKRDDRRLQLALARNSRQAYSVADLGVYAPVVERGDKRRHHQPHPFLIPAWTEQKPTAVQDINQALNKTVEDIAK